MPIFNKCINPLGTRGFSFWTKKIIKNFMPYCAIRAGLVKNVSISSYANASVNSKHQYPPRATPGVLHSTAAPGPGFILDDLPRGPGFCISIKLRLVIYKKSIGLVFIAISSGIKSFGTLLSPNLLFLCLTITYIEYVIRHCHKIPPCKRI